VLTQPASDRATARFAVWRSLLWPTLRVSRLGPVCATVLLGSVPLFVTLIRDGADLATPVIMLGIACGAATGWISDDPIVELAAPCPVNAPRRVAYRIAVAGIVASIGGAAVVSVAAIAASATPHVGDRVPVSAAAAAIALACGLFVRRGGDPLAGASGVAAGVLGPLLVAALAYRWPGEIPSFSGSPIHDRWWLIAGCAALVAAHASRDPAAGRLCRSPTEN
jgi:hypothetical protein